MSAHQPTPERAAGSPQTAGQRRPAFIVSSGSGQVYLLYPCDGIRERLLQDTGLSRLAWDNHLCAFQTT